MGRADSAGTITSVTSVRSKGISVTYTSYRPPGGDTGTGTGTILQARTHNGGVQGLKAPSGELRGTYCIYGIYGVPNHAFSKVQALGGPVELLRSLQPIKMTST